MVRRITYLSMLLTILIAQENILMILPNIQLSFVLLFSYSNVLKKEELISVIIAYVLIDNMQYGGFGIYTLAMLGSWLIVCLTFKYVSNKIDNIYILSTCTVPLSIMYLIPFSFTHYIMFGNIIAYIINGLSFTIILISNNYITTLLLYDKINNIILKPLETF